MSAMPRSETRSVFAPTIAWLAPVAALVMAGNFVSDLRQPEGPQIEIHFKDGSGLREGKTDLRLRGVNVGEVRRIELEEGGRGVRVKVRLFTSAKGLTNEGARFWIVRPQLSAQEVRGLSTVLSGANIEAQPGGGAQSLEFTGLEEPPLPQETEASLRVKLFSSTLENVKRGTPVLYRGVKVGAVASARLTEKALSVEYEALIEKRYSRLVRKSSRFWNAGSPQAHFALLHGLDVSAESLGAILGGAVEMATPDPPGPEAESGAGFPLDDKANEDWLKWNPRIDLDSK
jgi:paraquat-inducible protein B